MIVFTVTGVSCNLQNQAEIQLDFKSVSGSAVSGSATSSKNTDKGANSKPTTVIDETGQKCTLKIDTINSDDVGTIPSSCWFGNVIWNQVYKNHFYYVCYNKWTDNGYEYSLYKDKGEKLATFQLLYESDAIDMCIFNNTLYLILTGDDSEGGTHGVCSREKIGMLNLGTGEISIIYNITDYETPYSLVVAGGNFNYWESYIFYGDKIYFVGNDSNFERSLIAWNIEENFKRQKICKYNKIRENRNGKLFFMNDKIYYGERKGQKINLYCFDLDNCKKNLILSFHCKEKRSVAIDIQMDENYLYCNNYIVPINGGKIVNKPLQYLSGDSFVHNSKYIFYLDTKYKLHRVDKKNLQKDTVISDKKFFSIDCTENELYLKKYDKKWFEDDLYKSLMGDYAEGEKEYDYDIDDCTVDEVDNEEMELYTMDFDGTDLEKILNEE